MRSIASKYQAGVRRATGYLAVWPPTLQLSVGDVVERSAGDITHVSRVDTPSSRIGALRTSSRQQAALVELAVGATFSLETSATAAGQQLEVSFSQKAAYLLRASIVETTSVLEPTAVDEIMQRLGTTANWSSGWVLVTEVVTTDWATISVANAKGATVSAVVSSDAPTPASLSTIEVGAKLQSRTSSALTFNLDGGYTPFIRGRVLKHRTLSNSLKLSSTMGPSANTLMISTELEDWYDLGDGITSA